jgi:hypothetical protein
MVLGILTSGTIALSKSSLDQRFMILDNEFKIISHQLAAACSEHGILRYALDESYQGNEQVTLGTENCMIETVYIDGTNIVIKSRASKNRAITKLQTNFDQQDLALLSQFEIN